MSHVRCRSPEGRALLEVLTGGLPAVSHLGDMDTAAWVRGGIKQLPLRPLRDPVLTSCARPVQAAALGKFTLTTFTSRRSLTAVVHNRIVLSKLVVILTRMWGAGVPRAQGVPGRCGGRLRPATARPGPRAGLPADAAPRRCAQLPRPRRLPLP